MVPKPPNKYWVVKEGRVKGIFDKWEEGAELQVKMYKEPIYRGFPNLAEAQAYWETPVVNVGGLLRAQAVEERAKTPTWGNQRLGPNYSPTDSYERREQLKRLREGAAEQARKHDADLVKQEAVGGEGGDVNKQAKTHRKILAPTMSYLARRLERVEMIGVKDYVEDEITFRRVDLKGVSYENGLINLYSDEDMEQLVRSVGYDQVKTDVICKGYFNKIAIGEESSCDVDEFVESRRLNENDTVVDLAKAVVMQGQSGQ